MNLLRPPIYSACVLGFAWLAGMEPVRGPWQAAIIALALFAGWVGVFQNKVTGDTPPTGGYVPGGTGLPKPPTPPVAPRTPRVTDLPSI